MKNNSHNEPLEARRTPREESELAGLLKVAGPRPAPPEGDKEIVKAAALAQWQWTVRQERRRRTLRRGTFALAAAAALFFAFLHPVVRSSLGFGAGEPVATLAVTWGDVRGGEDRELAPLAAGEELASGTEVETRGGAEVPSRAVFRLAGGSTLRLDTGSRLRLISSRRLALDRGAVYVDSGPEGAPVEILTPLGEVRDIGTRFEVRLEEGETVLRVRVRDGEVELGREGKTFQAGAGEEMLQGADGTVTRSRVEPDSPAWAWASEALPPFPIEGKTLREFLLWASHEGGWELRYGEEDLEAEAARTMLFGSIDGLSLEDALSAMLAGSALSHRLEEGLLFVDRTP